MTVAHDDEKFDLEKLRLSREDVSRVREIWRTREHARARTRLTGRALAGLLAAESRDNVQTFDDPSLGAQYVARIVRVAVAFADATLAALGSPKQISEPSSK